MNPAVLSLPIGFSVRLHSDVAVGRYLVAGSRLVRASSSAQAMLRGRRLRVTSSGSATLAARLLDLDLADPETDEVLERTVDDMMVVVPVRDNVAGIDRLLAGLAPELACIVVDDASTDARGIARVVERHGARLIRLDHNVGPAAARDLGARCVETSLVVFVDSDVEVDARSLRRLSVHFADPGLAAVAPRIKSRRTGGWLGYYEFSSGSLDLGATSATTRAWSAVSYVPSACLMMRVDDVAEGFDPRMRSGEDVDLVWRLQDAGRRVRHAAEVEVLHDPRRSLGAWLARKAFYGTSAAQLAQRHGDRMAPAVLTPLAAATAAGLLLQRPWSIALAVGAGTAAWRGSRSAYPDLPAAQHRAVVTATWVAVARQTSGLVLRHWSPLSLLLCMCSHRARRVVGTMAVVDGLVAYRALRPRMDPVRFVALRRAEHLAYGMGVWWGAARAGSWRCLAPRWLPSSSGQRGS